MEAIIYILIVVFVILSAFYSSAEIAYAKANIIRIKNQAEEGSKVAKTEEYISENYTRSLSTVLVGNNLVNIAASSATTILCVKYFGEVNGQTIATVAITIILLIFGETIPKIIAAEAPDKFARICAGPLKISMWIFYPIVWLVEKFVGLISPIWTPKKEEPSVTTEELQEIVENLEDEGVFEEDDSERIQSAIEFSETTAKEVLVPRVDVFAIDIDKELVISEEFYRYARVPVYKDSIDNIVGILSTKQLLRAIVAKKSYKLEDFMSKPIFVHMTKDISSIVEEFRKSAKQMAVVVDEYGGTMGILTIEDIAEEIVGEIYDERDVVETDIKKINDNTYIVDGSENIYDLFDELDWEPSDFKTEYTTVGGWVTEMLDDFPNVGDSFEFERIKVIVLEIDDKRVEKVKVIYKNNDEEETKE